MAQIVDFESLYYQYKDKVYRLCMGYLNDTEAAKDLMQEIFVAVWENLPTFRNEASVGTWIYRIASNACLRQIQKNKKVVLHEVLETEDETPFEPEVQKLYNFIAALPEIERIIITLELEETPQSQIAEITGLSEGNVRVKIHRIKEKLTKKFHGR